MSTPPLADLAARIGYAFRDESLALEALTHPSVGGGARGTRHYERLEFLGDRILGLAIAEALYHADPAADQGVLTKRLHELARQETLAAVAVALDLGPFIRLAGAEKNAKGRDKPSILADVCESLIAAIYLDGGFEPAVAFVQRHWAPHLAAVSEVPVNAKSALQEWAQGRGQPAPLYRETGREGPAHSPTFRVEVAVEGFIPAEGEGPSKQAAEQAAAAALLARIAMAMDAADEK